MSDTATLDCTVIGQVKEVRGRAEFAPASSCCPQARQGGGGKGGPTKGRPARTPLFESQRSLACGQRLAVVRMWSRSPRPAAVLGYRTRVIANGFRPHSVYVIED